MGIECLKMFLIYQKIFKVAIVSFILISVGGGSYYKKTSPNSNWNKPHKNVPQNPFCRFTRNSSCSGISPQRCLAHIIAKSYHFRTVIQLSRCTREKHPSRGKGLERQKIKQIRKLFYFC